MSYKKALRKLEKLPIGERQLAAGQYVWEVKKGKSHCGCAIGKLLTERQRVRLFKHESNGTGVAELMDEFLKINGVNNYGYVAHADPSGVLDLTYGEANRLQSANDTFLGVADATRNSYASRKARYKHVVAWLKEQVAAGDTEAEEGAAEDR